MPRDVALAIAAGLAALVEQGKDPVELMGLRKAKGERQAVQRAAPGAETGRALAGGHRRPMDRPSAPRGAQVRRDGAARAGAARVPPARAADIGKADAWAVYDGLAAKGQTATALRAMRQLRALLSFAVERELIETNKLLGMKRLPKVAPRERVLIKFPHDEDEGEPSPGRADGSLGGGRSASRASPQLRQGADLDRPAARQGPYRARRGLADALGRPGPGRGHVDHRRGRPQGRPGPRGAPAPAGGRADPSAAPHLRPCLRLRRQADRRLRRGQGQAGPGKRRHGVAAA